MLEVSGSSKVNADVIRALAVFLLFSSSKIVLKHVHPGGLQLSQESEKKLRLKCHSEHVSSWVYSAPGLGCKDTSDFNKCVIFYWPVQDFTPHHLYPQGRSLQTVQEAFRFKASTKPLHGSTGTCVAFFTPICFVLFVYVHDSRLSVIKLRIETQIEKPKLKLQMLIENIKPGCPINQKKYHFIAPQCVLELTIQIYECAWFCMSSDTKLCNKK